MYNIVPSFDYVI